MTDANSSTAQKQPTFCIPHGGGPCFFMEGMGPAGTWDGMGNWTSTVSKRGLDPAFHIGVGQALAPLREQGVLIVGSGLLDSQRLQEAKT